MKRIEVIKAVGEKEGLIICNIGLPSRELYNLNDKPSHFYMLGSMGMASSIGLTTIAHHAPDNYCLIIIDNGSYGSTGNQPTRTAHKTDLGGIARAAGISQVKTVSNLEDLQKTLNSHQNESLVLIAKTDNSKANVPHIPLLPRFLKMRFTNEVMKG